jgi:hypothetical protein
VRSFYSIESQLPPPMQPWINAMLHSLVGWIARCTQVIAEAGIADALDAEPCSAGALAAVTGCNADALERMLRLLASVGLFERLPDGRYQHSAGSRLMRTDHEASVAHTARMQGMEVFQHALARLAYSLKTGATAIRDIAPDGLFPYLAQHPEQGRIFNDAMTAFTDSTAAGVAAAYDFSTFKVIADIGGGHGRLLSEVLARAPGAKGILVDLPEVIAETQQLSLVGVQRIAANFFRDSLPQADGYVLKHILHDWDDAAVRALLRNIRGAAPPDARLLIAETLLPDGSDFHPAMMMDISMLAILGGRERSRAEFSSLLADSAFTLTNVVPVEGPGGISIMEAKPV